MPLRQAVLSDRRFWAALCVGGFGQIREWAEPETLCRIFGLNEQATLDWFNEFTGWERGTFDESDGYSADPAMVRASLAKGIELRVEFHPGDLLWFLRSPDPAEAMLASIGPHWALPGLRWQEAIAIAKAVGRASVSQHWCVLLLLLPTVWLTEDDDVDRARRSVESAWIASMLMDPQMAAQLSSLWVKAVAVGGDYSWRQLPGAGWVTDAEWSTRGPKSSPAELVLVNRLVSSAAEA